MTTRPIRVLHLNLVAARNRVLAAQLDHTDQAEVEWSVAVLGGAGPLQQQLDERGVPLVCLDVDDARDLRRTVPRLRAVLRDTAPDVVHAHLLWPSMALEIARITLRHAPPSVHTRHHNGSHHATGRRLHVRMDRWVAAHATRAIAVSVAVKQTMVERDGVRADHISVVHNGLDASAVRADQHLVKQWREKFGSSPLAVAVGRLDPEKDYPTLLRALAGARRHHPGLRLAVAGTGPDGAQSGLEATARALGLAGAVDFVGWQEDVFSLVAAADVFVQASRDEALPQSVMEAMVLGVPTAVTTVGGTAEVVGPTHPAVGPGDAEALGNRIVAVLDDPGSARATANAAAADTAARFSPTRSAAEHVRIYRNVTGPVT